MTSPEPFPLTRYQLDIWVSAAQSEESPQYNVSLYEKLTGNVNLDVLRQCVEQVLRRHDALRLRFDERDGTPLQWVEPRIPVVETADLSREGDPAAACRRWVRAFQQRPMPLRDQPMVRAVLLVESARVTHLQLVAHHLVMDGWALKQVSAEILDGYASMTAGATAAENSAPSYRLFSERDAAYQGSEENTADLAAHCSALAGAVPALFPRKPTSAPREAARYSFSLDRSWAARVRKAQLPLFPYIATVLGAYLSRVHRAEEVTLGVPVLNRPREFMDTVGHFANTLPLRLPAHHGMSLRDIVNRTRTATRALRVHERAALGDVVRRLRDSDGGNRQLFDVTLSYLRAGRPDPGPGIDVETAMESPCHEQDVLSVVVLDFDNSPEIRFDLDYATDVFDDDFPVEGMAEHFKNLLEAAVDMADGPMSAVPMLSAAERAELIRHGRGESVAYPRDATLSGLFERQAARAPARIAVVGPGPDDALTYAELDARANQVARALRADGVGPGDRVAVMMERGPDLLVALMGVGKAGGAYVPVDPGYPRERIGFLLDDSRPAAILTSDESEPRISTAAGVPVHRVPDLLHGDDSPPEPAADGSDLAYVIYTSGSTGRPKGVLVRHHSVVNRLAWMQRAYPIGEGDVLLQKTPVSFDVSVWELFWWAIEGASVALLPPGGEKDPRVIGRTIHDRGVTVAHFVPSMLGAFLDAVEQDPDVHAGTRTLRRVFCSGEALPAARVDRFNRIFHGAERATPALVNLYGPTEATVDVTFHDCPGEPGRPVGRVPIGRPIDNTCLYVVGRNGQPQPKGVPGELWIGGAGVAAGYLNRPALTGERFIADPFTGEGSLYRTGDLVRWLADGTLEYLGRLDDQVKIRGNRVEPGEVGRALIAVPGVRDALVVDRTDDERGVHLVGYYVAEDGIAAADVRRHLADTLPEFMMPALLVPLDRIPLTPNGKADRRALPDPVARGGVPVSRPLTSAEEIVADVWQEVLRCGPVGAEDDYYALGGDSLQMLRIRALAEQRGLRFSLADLVRHSTVAGLAARAHHDGSPTDVAECGPLPFETVSGIDRARLGSASDAYPLTRMQLGLIYHSRQQRRSSLYKDVFRYTLRCDWDEQHFRAAFGGLVRRHPALRTSFGLAGFTEPLQLVHPPMEDGLEVVDLRSRDGDDAETEVLRHIEERRHHEYAFDTAPLYSLRVHIRRSAIDLVLSFHHALLDGASVANLIGELLRDYGHALGLHPTPAPEVRLPSPAAHLLAERRALASEADRRYWRAELAGSEPVSIGTFRPHQPPSSASGRASHRFNLPARLGDDVRTFAREQALPVKSVLFAAHCMTLRLFSGREDVMTGLIAHSRPEHPHAERMVGLFLNTLPMRVNTAQASWLEAVREAFRREQGAYPHRHYPMSAIQEERGSAPLFDTVFNYVRFQQLTDALGEPGLELMDFRTVEETNFTLLVNAVTDPVDQSIWLRIDNDGQTVTHDQVRLFADSYTRILGHLIHHPLEQPGWDFLTLVPQPLPPATDVARSAVDRFAEQAARTPHALALTTHDERWTYARLDRVTATVARNLIALGVRPGAVVGVAADRSPEVIAAILGIMRAGAAVMPLDTGYPAKRLSRMIEEADPFLVVAGRHDAFPDQDAPTVWFEQIAEPPTGDAPAAPVPALAPDSTACVLFTSGSTGRPKGVDIPHRTLACLVSWQNRARSASQGITLQYAPLSFDVSLQEIFSTLCAGGTLRLVPEDIRRDMPALVRLMHQEGVERIFLPYIALQQLALASEALGIAPAALRVIVSSGEQLRITDEIRRLCSALPGVVLENQYGPTETHVVTRHTLTGPPADFPDLPPVGTAVDGAQVVVVDPRLRPVPPGVTGELYLGGASVARGYLGRDDLTKERFVTLPGTPGRFYRSGDLGFALPSGEIVCTGRADTQVKVRGFRVETAEVELAIRDLVPRHPGIAEAAVVAHRRPGTDTVLVAFLTGDPSTVDTGALRGRLRETLPDYMVPSYVQWLPAMPSTPSGKRDDAALRAIPLEAPADHDTTPPRTPLEKALAEILADLLHLPEVGIHDSMFDLGGTSLTAMRLIATLEQRFGTVIPLSEFIAAPTVAAMATRLRSGATAPARLDPIVPLNPAGSRTPLFLVHPMGGNVLCFLPFARHLDPEQPLYALQATGADPGTEPLNTIADMARSYLTAVRRIQPEGPYKISGYSFGGFVAFEMACQLRAAGERAEVLILDTVALNPQLRELYTEDALLGWFFWELLWPVRGGASPLEEMPEHATTLDAKFAHIARCAVDLGVLPADSSGTVIRRLFRLYRANWLATLDYRPDTVDQDIVLLRADEPLPAILEAMHGAAGSLHYEPTNGWRRMTTGRIQVIGIPGDHLSMIEEPGVAHVAKTVADILHPSTHLRRDT
ncbi:non-ribosomal peptide synthetase [Streptomyces lonegramiae]|uniref:Amino acid adenylation domain-containing protein n=1 Tax=Streptomyces lonegramiae TaxID=3075524 RepID=A0ABU2XC68_9ACTN|nr:non-ribosomal peptide synthetase [Streptomyces sp. DSM 41529]MDT0543515.1 amino acid adenylation domain-containing protein [Streptomyces sp. DSM 41529]